MKVYREFDLPPQPRIEEPFRLGDIDMPPTVWICSCGHEESAHVVHTEIAYDFTIHNEVNEEYEVETYPCALCDGLCQNFEVWS